MTATLNYESSRADREETFFSLAREYLSGADRRRTVVRSSILSAQIGKQRFIWQCCASGNHSKHKTFTQRRPNVFAVGPTLYKWYTSVLRLLDAACICSQNNVAGCFSSKRLLLFGLALLDHPLWIHHNADWDMSGPGIVWYSTRSHVLQLKSDNSNTSLR